MAMLGGLTKLKAMGAEGLRLLIRTFPADGKERLDLSNVEGAIWRWIRRIWGRMGRGRESDHTECGSEIVSASNVFSAACKLEVENKSNRYIPSVLLGRKILRLAGQCVS